MKNTFATCINCIDGRVQLPAINFIKKSFKADFVDMVTYPGVDKILSGKNSKDIISIKKKVKLSVKVHNPEVVIIVGHYDCLANPVTKAVHIKQIKSSIKTIQKWNLDVNVKGLWIDSSWQAHRLK